jgi:adenylate cyclase
VWSRNGSLRYLFEDYELDTDRRELRRRTMLVPLPPQVFDMLVYLIENRERVVSKDDLIAAVWRGRIVSDSALTTRLNAARNAIGDSGEQQHFIKTLPRKGFRFIGQVLEEKQSQERADLGALSTPPTSALPLPDKPSIAVLPFANLSGDPKEDYFSDGITEDIITELSRFSDLFVIARNSSFQYKGKSPDIRQVGRELGVRHVLEGSIRRAGDRVRITGQLIDATTGAHRWAERYDRELKDIFAVQDEVARSIVAILVAHVNKAEIERTLLKPPSTWQAYDYYLRAADAFTSYLSSFDVKQLYETRRISEHSLRVDPNYARGYTVLSNTFTTAYLNALDADYLNPSALDRAYQLATRAIQLHSSLPQAHAQLAYVLALKGRHQASIASFEKAIALNPSFADWRFTLVLTLAGSPAAAIQIGESYTRLDPFYPPPATGFLGLAYYMLRKYEEAVPPLRECVTRAPNYRAGHAALAAALAQMGQLEEARVEVAEVLRIDPKYTIDGTGKKFGFFRNPDDARHFFDGLRKAGLPDK